MNLAYKILKRNASVLIRRLHPYRQVDKQIGKGNATIYLKILEELRPNRNGLKTVGAFIREIKRNNPKFNYQEEGFVKASDFVRSLPGIKVEKNLITKE